MHSFLRSRSAIFTAIVLLHLTWVVPAYANGAEILRNCTTALRIAKEPNFVPNLFEAASCVNYVAAILQTATVYQQRLPREKWILCIPKDVRLIPLSDYVEIIVDYLKTHPERLEESRFDLVLNALEDAFPCFSS